MMLGFPSVNPETLESWKGHLRSKLAIVVLVLLLSPRARLGDGLHSSSVTVRNQLPEPPRPTPDISRWITTRGAASEHSRVVQVPLTASDPNSVDAARPTGTIRHVRQLSTSHQIVDSHVGSATPALSDPPASAAAQSDPSVAPPFEELGDATSRAPQSTVDCPIDFRGRPMCGDATRTPSSLAKRSSELADAAEELALWILSSVASVRITLSPFALFCILFCMLSCIHLAALVLEDSILRLQMANPLPPDFARGDTWTKRISRWQWRVNLLVQRYALQLLVCALLAAVAGWCLFESAAEVNPANNWADVPYGRWLLAALDDSDVSLRTRNGPYRTLLAIESLSALVALIQPVKHFLPSSILPATVSPPIALLSSHQSAPAVRVDSCWLVSHLVEMTLSLMTLAQLCALGVKLSSISPFKIAPHLIFHAARGRLVAISNIQMSMNRTVDCLRTVFEVFPESNGEKADVALESEEADWVCTICFEGDSSTTGEMTATARCRLPCGHKYHAGCLTKWLGFQSFCPVCHKPVADESEDARRAASLAEAPPLIDMSDVYPGLGPRRRVMA
ncbi:hypothetical protein ACM66B_000090 [Microbotryomycetes sp. NB124-2]